MPLFLILTLDGTDESRRLTAGGLTVGRSAGNDWVLTDTAAQPAMSRRHCRFDMGPRGATVMDLGSTNGTQVNGQPLAARKATPLRGGESIEIGMRRLTVELLDSEAQSSDLPALSPANSDPSVGVRGLKVPQTPQPRRWINDPAARSPEGLPGPMFRSPERPATPADSQLQKDPLAGNFQQDLPPLPRNRKITPVSEQRNVEAAPQLEAMLPRRRQEPTLRNTVPTGDFPDPLGAFNRPEPAEPPAPKMDTTAPETKPRTRRRPDTDPDPDPFGLADGEKAYAQVPKRKPGAPRTQQVSPAPEDVDHAPNPNIDAAAGDLLRAAFLAGANLPALTADDRPPEVFFNEAGRMFAKLADGLRELLAVRALVKDHAGLDRTQLSATLNNPLKLSVNTREAVAGLLSRPEDGYLTPLAAVEASFRDLKAHELAILNGVQSAVDELLALFKPAKLERKLDGSGMLANILQGGKRARLWELYQERYDDIANSARARFMGRMNDAFRTGYSRKTAEMSRNGERPGAFSRETSSP